VWWLLTTGVFLFTYIAATNQLVLKIIIPVLLLVVLGKEKRIAIDRGLGLYIFVVIWGCFSLFYTVDSVMTLRYVQGMIGNVIIWYLASRCIRKVSDLKKLSYPLILSFLSQLYFTLIAPVQASAKVIAEQLDRVTGLSPNENDQGRLLAFGIVVAVLLIVYTKNKFFKVLYWLSILLFFIGIFRTGSRSALIAILICIIGFIFLNAQKRNYGVLIVAILISVLIYNYGYMYLMNNTSMGHRLELAVERKGNQPRIILLKEGVTFFLQNPIFGLGLGSYVYYSTTHHYSHNDYIEILASMGLPAFLIYISIFWDYWKKARICFRYSNDYFKKFILISISFLFTYLAFGIWDPSIYYPTTTLMLAFFYSFVLKLFKKYKQQQKKIFLEEKVTSIKLN
jgi:O-antigen ligase